MSIPMIRVRARGNGTMPHFGSDMRPTSRARPVGRGDSLIERESSDPKNSRLKITLGAPIVEAVHDLPVYRRAIARGDLELVTDEMLEAEAAAAVPAHSPAPEPEVSIEPPAEAPKA